MKYNVDGSVNKYKTKVVAKGYAQTHGIDYDETFAPVAKMMMVHAFLTVTTETGWHLHQMDVKNAFLQDELEKEGYMVQPLGFQLELHKWVVCRLKKSLYGLKQAPHIWNFKITQYLCWIGFQTSQFDTSLFIRIG